MDGRSASAGHKTATPASQTYGMYEDGAAYNHPVDAVISEENGCIVQHSPRLSKGNGVLLTLSGTSEFLFPYP
jgi:hypothetical protein